MAFQTVYNGWDRLVLQAIDAAWTLGHILLGFERDTESSIVTNCVRCGAYACVDGDEAFGRALTKECERQDVVGGIGTPA